MIEPPSSDQSSRASIEQSRVGESKRGKLSSSPPLSLAAAPRHRSRPAPAMDSSAPPAPAPSPPPAELPEDASSSEEDESDGEPIVPLLAGREKRSNAGNRMRALLDEEQGVEEEEMFKEDEGDDEFETKGARALARSVACVGGAGWTRGGSLRLGEQLTRTVWLRGLQSSREGRASAAPGLRCSCWRWSGSSVAGNSAITLCSSSQHSHNLFQTLTDLPPHADEADVFDSDFGSTDSGGEASDAEAGERTLEREANLSRRDARNKKKRATHTPFLPTFARQTKGAVASGSGTTLEGTPGEKRKKERVPAAFGPVQRESSRKSAVAFKKTVEGRLVESEQRRVRPSSLPRFVACCSSLHAGIAP